MSEEIFLIIFCLINILLIVFFKFSKFLLDNPEHGQHKNISHQGIPLIGGAYFLTCSFIIFVYEDSLIVSKIYFIFFLLIFILGVFSDSYKNMSPKIRLMIQVLIISNAVYFLDIKIDKTSLSFLDLLISNYFFNLFFTIFCLLVLLNGSNFCDGVNLNVVGYFLIIFLCLTFLDKDYSESNNLKLIILCLSVFYITNYFNYSFLGDNGV